MALQCGPRLGRAGPTGGGGALYDRLGYSQDLIRQLGCSPPLGAVADPKAKVLGGADTTLRTPDQGNRRYPHHGHGHGGCGPKVRQQALPQKGEACVCGLVLPSISAWEARKSSRPRGASRSTFGQWTLGERVAILDRTCWETSHTLQCAPWPWRVRSPLWGAAPTAERGAFSDGSPNREAEGQGGADPVRLGGPGAPGKGGDNDSVLMLRQMYLTLLAYQGLGQRTVPQVGSSFLEHPMDPMECRKSPSAARCSTIWVTRAYIQWANALHHSLIKFDECCLGQVVVKSTTLSRDLPLHHWHDLRCNHGAHPRKEKLNSTPVTSAGTQSR